VAVRDTRSVSGALLVTCEPFRLDDSRVPYSAEIVGLR